MKISLKFLEICCKHEFFVVSTGFFSAFILIVLNFWSARKNHIGKKVPMWYNDFTFHVDISWMLTWVRKTVQSGVLTAIITYLNKRFNSTLRDVLRILKILNTNVSKNSLQPDDFCSCYIICQNLVKMSTNYNENKFVDKQNK